MRTRPSPHSKAVADANSAVATSAAGRLLRQIPGRFIVDGMASLPACGPEADRVEIPVDAGFFGKFRVTYRPYAPCSREGHSKWFWIAESAERVDS